MSNYTPEDSVPVVAHKTGVAQGRALERKLIVAWLRSEAGVEWICEDIEAGEHLK